MRSEIEYVCPNYYILPCEESVDEINDTGSAIDNAECIEPNVTPNDSQYTSQYALTKISAPNAWNVITGSGNIRVGIIDSGIASHNDLNANVVAGWDFFNNNGTTTDDKIGHGTHVAGIIGAVGSNSIGVTGVCWNISLVPLQVLIDDGSTDDGKFENNAIISAIVYATNNDIPIINCSFGAYNSSNVFEYVMSNYGGVIVCASGNGKDTNGDGYSDTPVNTDTEPHFPSCSTLNNLISVAATNQYDNLAPFSNYGAVSVDLSAPGVEILSTYPMALESTGYKKLSGTSMAAPFVTGTAALLLSKYSYLTPFQVKESIINGVDIMVSLNGMCVSSGRLNARGALDQAASLQNLRDLSTLTVSGNFNSDNKCDTATFRYNLTTNNTEIVVLLSNGSSFSNPILWYSNNQSNFEISRILGRITSGDYNGDGLTDIAVFYDYGNYDTGLFIFWSNGTSFNPSLVYRSGANNFGANSITGRVVSGDYNGDGKCDIAAFYDYGNFDTGIWIFWGSLNQDITFTNPIRFGPGNFDANAITGRVASSDCDGDGKADIGVFYDAGYFNTFLMVFWSSGESFSWSQPYVSGAGNFDANAITRRVTSSDYNGDGFSDFAVFYDCGGYNTSVIVFTSTGPNKSFTWPTWYQSGPGNFDPNCINGTVVSGAFNETSAGICTYYDLGLGRKRLIVFNTIINTFSNNVWYEGLI